MTHSFRKLIEVISGKKIKDICSNAIMQEKHNNTALKSKFILIKNTQ